MTSPTVNQTEQLYGAAVRVEIFDWPTHGTAAIHKLEMIVEGLKNGKRGRRT